MVKTWVVFNVLDTLVGYSIFGTCVYEDIKYSKGIKIMSAAHLNSWEPFTPGRYEEKESDGEKVTLLNW